MSILSGSNVPGCSFRVCGVEDLLYLLFGGTLNASGVRELESVVTMDVVNFTVVLEYVHYLAPADEVVDAVFDLRRSRSQRCLFEAESSSCKTVLGSEKMPLLLKHVLKLNVDIESNESAPKCTYLLW